MASAVAISDSNNNNFVTSETGHHHTNYTAFTRSNTSLENRSSNMEWNPLPKIARGIAVGRYNPAPDTAVQGIDSPIDVGDEVYVFESHSSGKWYRGYVVTAPRAQSAFNQPLPRLSQRLNNAALKPLDFDISLGIFPSAIISLKQDFDLTLDTSNNRESRGMGGSSIKDRMSIASDSTTTHYTKQSPPAIPAIRLDNEAPTMSSEPLVDDITSVIKEWYNTYVYHHFLHGNYRLVMTIQDVIKDLYEIRRKLVYNLVTSNERVIARKKAVWQIARVTKMLNRGIVVRDPTTGEILSRKDGPVKLAQEQMLLALAPNYPDHAVVGDYAKEFVLPKHILVDFKSCAGQNYGRGLTVYLHLRTKTHRLTESFQVKVHKDTEISDLSAVLFKDLPVSVAKDDVYLVAHLKEDVPLKSQYSTSISSLIGGPTGKPGSPSQFNGENSGNGGNNSNIPKSQITHARRGVAAGAADISRLFRMEESVESPFTIRMYTTYFSPGEPSDDNRGWGELVDRIVRGRPSGV